jgi:hypothetical protein
MVHHSGLQVHSGCGLDWVACANRAGRVLTAHPIVDLEYLIPKQKKYGHQHLPVKNSLSSSDETQQVNIKY